MPTPTPRPPQPLLPTTPLHGSTCRRPRPRPSAAPHPRSASAFTNAATQPTPHRPAATDPPCAPPLCRVLSVSCETTVECRRGMSMCAACGHRHLATCVCSCNMMIAQVTHALLAPGAGRPTVLHSRQGRGRGPGRFFLRETRDRASSAEIIATWPYAPAGGMARKLTHERYLGRRRSSQSEELTTRTCIAPARCAPRKSPMLPEIARAQRRSTRLHLIPPLVA